MAFTSQLYTFASDSGADVYTPAEWLTNNDRLIGFVAGLGHPKPLNTAMRQAAFTSAMIGKFTADYGIDNVLDDGDVPKYEANFVAALKRVLAVVAPTNLLYEGTDTGTANAAVVTATSPVLTAPFPVGYFIAVKKINTQNSGAMTLQVLGTSHPITWPDGNLLGPGDYPAGAEAIFYNSGSAFQLVTWTGKVNVTQLGQGEGIRVGEAAVHLNFPGLTEEDDLAATDLFAFYQTVAEGGLDPNHHRKTTWGNIVSKVLAQIHRTASGGGGPIVGGGVPGPDIGNFIIQTVWTNYAGPASQGLTVGKIASGGDLQRGGVSASLLAQDPINSSSPPGFTQLNVWFGSGTPLGHGGQWNWPFILPGTWRCASWNWVFSSLGGWPYAFEVYWVRIS